MTREQFNNIQERCRNATKGEWVYDESESTFTSYEPDEKGFTHSTPILFAEMEAFEDDCHLFVSKEDAEFIAHSRVDIPLLLDEIEILNSEIIKLKEEYKTSLKKQTPIEPFIKTIFEGERAKKLALLNLNNYLTIKCPSCNNIVAKRTLKGVEPSNYCEKCGQRIDPDFNNTLLRERSDE